MFRPRTVQRRISICQRIRLCGAAFTLRGDATFCVPDMPDAAAASGCANDGVAAARATVPKPSRKHHVEPEIGGFITKRSSSAHVFGQGARGLRALALP